MRNPPVTQPIFTALRKPLSLAARTLMGTITRVDTNLPVLALTFDDGPHPEYTPRLLEVLDKYHAKATFFCVGKFAAKHPDVIRRAVEGGHVVGNHTWDHPSLPLLAPRELREQIRKCANALMPYGRRLFRPPHGHQNHVSRAELLRQGYQAVTWSGAPRDWKLTDPGQILAEVLPHVQPGAIIDLHDRIATAISPENFNREPTIEVIEEVLRRFGNRYRFLTLPELFRLGTVVRVNWYRDPDISKLNALIEEDNSPSRQYTIRSKERIIAPFYM